MLAVQYGVISLISVISPLDECEWPGSALTGAPHYARALKESSGGSHGSLRARTKRGAWPARRDTIEIVSGEMAPLSAGLIAGGSERPAGELALLNRGEVTVHRENRDLKPPPWNHRAPCG